jgi:hypothetical protein
MQIAVRRAGLLAAGLTPLILATAGHAVILYATADRNGTPAPGSIAEVPWSLQGQWGGFLGTPIAPNYFLAAVHVGGDPNSNFVFRDGVYTIDTSYGTSGSFSIPGSDLRIWKVNETFPAYAPLYGTSSAASEVSKHMVVIGRGTQRGDEVTVNGVLKGWQWGATDFVQSWGENTITSIATGSASQGELITFDFNAGVANEGTLSGIDSSGGVFVQNGTEWQLAGINYGVDGPWSFTGDANDPGFNAAIFDSSGLFAKGPNETWVAAPGGPSSAYASRIGSSSRLSAIYSAIPSFAIKQQTFLVRGNTTVDVGTVDVSTSVTVGGSTTAATLKASYIRGGSLIINRASKVQIKPNGTDANVSRVTALTFNGTAIGQLDLTDNDMIVQSPTNPGQDLSFVINRIQIGRNGTATRWGGNGITSSTAQNDPNQLMGLGAILNDNGHGGPIYSTFDGVAVDMNSILIKYTLMGDLNLNGKIDPDDYFYLDRGFAVGYNPANPYLNGDVDYNGIINSDDYAILDRAYAMQVLAAAQAPSSLSLGISAVPEPATVGLLTFLLPVLARRRRSA